MIVYRKLILHLAFAVGIFFFGCRTQKETAIQVPEPGDFFEYLSEYQLFEHRGNKHLPSTQLYSYEVINSLFTDYAEKDRFIYIPPGEKAILKDDGFFNYPVNTIIVKDFYYTDQQISKGKTIETRLLIKEEELWKAVSYVWDEHGKDAKISKVGDQFELAIQTNTENLEFEYIVPNKNQCKSCHNRNEKIDPLGFKYTNINRNIKNEAGEEISQIDFFIENGIIEIPDDLMLDVETMISYENVNEDIGKRALAYLDVNCGHCHRPKGPGNTSGLFLQYDENRTNHLGYCKAPVAAGRGSGGRKFDIQPGKADSSILYYRMSSLDPGVMMPELGRSLAHREGLQIIEDWINSIDYDCYGD